MNRFCSPNPPTGRASLTSTMVAALALALGGCSYRAPARVAPTELPPVEAAPYLIQTADILDVSFFKTPELNQVRTVGPDGEISLSLIGRVAVAGRSVEQVESQLIDLYGAELVDPLVTVSVNSYGGLEIFIGGEVTQPGVRPFRGGITVVQALMDAGGFLPTARLSEVVLMRRGPDGQPLGTIVDVQRVLRDARFADDVALAPKDVLFVPRSRIADVNKFVQDYLSNVVPDFIFVDLRDFYR